MLKILHDKRLNITIYSKSFRVLILFINKHFIVDLFYQFLIPLYIFIALGRVDEYLPMVVEMLWQGDGDSFEQFDELIEKMIFEVVIKWEICVGVIN